MVQQPAVAHVENRRHEVRLDRGLTVWVQERDLEQIILLQHLPRNAKLLRGQPDRRDAAALAVAAIVHLHGRLVYVPPAHGDAARKARNPAAAFFLRVGRPREVIARGHPSSALDYSIGEVHHVLEVTNSKVGKGVNRENAKNRSGGFAIRPVKSNPGISDALPFGPANTYRSCHIPHRPCHSERIPKETSPGVRDTLVPKPAVSCPAFRDTLVPKPIARCFGTPLSRNQLPGVSGHPCPETSSFLGALRLHSG